MVSYENFLCSLSKFFSSYTRRLSSTPLRCRIKKIFKKIGLELVHLNSSKRPGVNVKGQKSRSMVKAKVKEAVDSERSKVTVRCSIVKIRVHLPQFSRITFCLSKVGEFMQTSLPMLQVLTLARFHTS